MEGRLWSEIVALLPAAAVGKSRFVYDTRTIVMVLLWAVVHDRPQAWACDRLNWPDAVRPRSLPDPSTLSRRKRRDDVAAVIGAMQERVRRLLGPPSRDAAIDSRPMVVGGASKDQEARVGRGVGGFSRGYRAHMLIDRSGVVRALEVRPMSVNERIVARKIIATAPASITRIAADANYDSVRLQELAASCSRRLYVRLRLGRVGRRQNPHRVRLHRLSGRRVWSGVMAARDGIERVFGRMSNIACGLKPLPSWVRGYDRVSLWIEAKVLIYHVYLLRQRKTA